MIETSILIPTKNGGPEFEKCLQGIYSQKSAGAFEVILVDSGSVDGTLEIASRYPVHVDHIPGDEFHHARTRNLLARLAKGEFLVFLSQDALPANDTWLSSLLYNFKDPSVGAAYGKQLAKLGYKYYHFSSVNAAIRKEVWQATRFPEDLKVFEDVGIAKRILEAGWSI